MRLAVQRRPRCGGLPVALTACVLSLALVACGGDDEGGGAGAAGASEQSGFPVTIEHAHGSTTIERAPKRVVTVGFTDHDPVLALGIKPVGAMDWLGERPYGKFPWVKDRWGDDKPEIVGAGGSGLRIEKIVKLRPDVIIGTYAGSDGLDRSTYDKLSRIAPTVAYSPKFRDYETPWQEATRTIGRALGREERANELIAAIEQRFAKVRQEHPEFARQTAIVVEAGAAPERYSAFTAGDPRGRFMANIGFKSSPAIDKAAGDHYAARLSPERLDLLDVDRLILLVDPDIAKKMEADPLYRQLDVVRAGRAVKLPQNTDPPYGTALAYNTVLSIPYGIDGILPQLTKGGASR